MTDKELITKAKSNLENAFKQTNSSFALAELNNQILGKRLEWLKENKHILDDQPTYVEKAFKALYTKLSIPKEELKIIEKTPTKIRYQSYNFCPVLEACKELKKDTRKICRQVYHNSTQEFLAAIHPYIKFTRNYTNMRPYGDNCEETIEFVDYEKFMKVALEEAKKSFETGNKGFGAVLIKDGKIISQNHDTVAQTNDPSSHAEMNVIREASKKLGADLNGCILISTCEPCLMCLGVALWAGIDVIAFGASIKKTIDLGCTRIDLPAKEVMKKSPIKPYIITGILEKECLKLYKK